MAALFTTKRYTYNNKNFLIIHIKHDYLRLIDVEFDSVYYTAGVWCAANIDGFVVFQAGSNEQEITDFINRSGGLNWTWDRSSLAYEHLSATVKEIFSNTLFMAPPSGQLYNAQCTTTPPKKCECPLDVLMHNGCECGGV